MGLTDLETFVHVATAGSFTAAGKTLGLPKSTISRRVSRLEAELGTALLRRSPRSIALTDDGRALADRCAPALAQLRSATSSLRDLSSPTGTLVISAAIDYSQGSAFAQLLVGFQRQHPAIRVRLLATNRTVDLFEEPVDVALRIHTSPLPDSDLLMARRLPGLSGGLYVAKELADGIKTWADVLRVGTVTHSREGNSWAFLSGVRTVEPAFVASDYAGIGALVRAGAGVALLPHFVAAPLLPDLIRVLPELEMPKSRLSAVWLRSRHLAPRIRSFIDYAAREL